MEAGELVKFDQVRKACDIAMYAGADFIKTSTMYKVLLRMNEDFFTFIKKEKRKHAFKLIYIFKAYLKTIK